MNVDVNDSYVRAWKRIQFFGLGLILVLPCLPGFSQVNLGRISGDVKDESGGILAGAKVIVTDQERGTARDLVTDEAGAYAAPSLIPGQYTVRVEANGFSTTETKDVLVTVGGDIRVDMVLKPGSQQTTVTVTEAVPLINTTSATLGGVMETQEVNDLPVIGRNWMQLLQLTPALRPNLGAARMAMPAMACVPTPTTIFSKVFLAAASEPRVTSSTPTAARETARACCRRTRFRKSV